MSTTLQVTVGMRFKEENVCFCVKQRVQGKPDTWLVQQSVPGGWRTKIKPPIEMAEKRIIEIAERQIGDNASGSLNTIGTRVGSRMRTQQNKTAPQTVPARFLDLYRDRQAARAALAT